MKDFDAVFPDASPLVAGVILLRRVPRVESTTCESGKQLALAPVEALASNLASSGSSFFR
jgi:hypothetical protein